MHDDLDRRAFLRTGATLGTALAVGHPVWAAEEGVAQSQPLEKIRIGFVGIGGRGSWLLKILLNLEGVAIKAVCDIIEDRVTKGQDMVVQAGQPKPAGYSRGETDFQRLCETEELDLVINAVRPWKWHVPICLAAMAAGRHTATEVPAAVTVDECWQLVEAAEKTRKFCVMLENCCYFRNVLLVHHMLRKGLFGELRHCEAGYQHYIGPRAGIRLRSSDAPALTGNSYPTHAIGPVAQWLDINRGNRFDYLVSMSADGTRGNPDADINTSLIRTVNGQTVTLYYDTRLPRPYDLIYRVQGTQGIYSATLDQIYFEGRSPQAETWEPINRYYDEFEHPLWKAWGEKALQTGGHGGADFLTLYRLIQALRTGAAPDMDVYDAATWSCITGLSEKSVAQKSSPQEFPDFTRGKWKTAPPIGILGAEA